MKIISLVLLLIFPFKLFAIDSDHDGVPDEKDRCPKTEQVKMVEQNFRYKIVVDKERIGLGVRAFPVDRHGCELDDDGDGVINSKDFCVDNTPEELVKGVAVNGCPKQSDKDGTPDYRDDCPDTPEGVVTDARGCPAIISQK